MNNTVKIKENKYKRIQYIWALTVADFPGFSNQLVLNYALRLDLFLTINKQMIFICSMTSIYYTHRFFAIINHRAYLINASSTRYVVFMYDYSLSQLMPTL